MLKKTSAWHLIILLVLAGESIFLLPFVLARIFRPSFLEVFQLNNTQLGYCFSIYGIVALLSYYFGGVLADRMKAKNLMSIALILTALGGMYMMTIPSYFMMKVLYGYWGFTTIFLFWSAMIKATRIWGGNTNQGKAFGFLDGGRGLVGASMGTIGVFIFSLFLVSDHESIGFVERQLAFKYVLATTSLLVIIIALLVFILLKIDEPEEKKNPFPIASSLQKNFSQVIKIPAVWLLMVIILCGYVGYKVTDIFSLYANEVMQYNEVKSAHVGTFLLYIRPVAGVLIGLLADRSRPSLWLLIGFILMGTGSILFASGILGPSMPIIFLFSLLIIALGTYAIRALYFAVMGEGSIPLVLTGTAVGLISFVGYTPDIFMGPVIGYLLDGNPGKTGHQYVFWLLFAFSIIGLLAAIQFYRNVLKERKT
jgi:sugar phosphate permease